MIIQFRWIVQMGIVTLYFLFMYFAWLRVFIFRAAWFVFLAYGTTYGIHKAYVETRRLNRLELDIFLWY